MGKAKKRNFNKNSLSKGTTLKREDIVVQILSDIKSKNISDESKNFVTLFGITTEELSEAGATYEELSIIKHLII